MVDNGAGWTESTVEVEGHDVFYRESTDVPGALPIVHVHGFGISGAYLMPTARMLASRATNLVPDLPGYGKSESWGYTLGIPALAVALLHILDALGLDKVVLVGNSMGCPISLEVAHAAPDRVDRIVLVSPAGGIHNQGAGPGRPAAGAWTARGRTGRWPGWPCPTTCGSARSTPSTCSAR